MTSPPTGRRRRATTFISHAAPHPARPPIRSSRPRSLRSWHTDITYVQTVDGWVYTATVIDLHSRKVVGYAVADHLRTSLIVEALAAALLPANPPAG